ncbi:MAG: hypothetical protein ABS939_02675 [Psychrobacillus sp.]
MKIKYVKYSTTISYWKHIIPMYAIEKLDGILILKEANTSRLGDYKKALGPKRYHNLVCGRL